MLVRDILLAKGSDVVTVEPEMTIVSAVRVLVEHNIGALVVMDESDVRGILTERDLLRAAARDFTGLASTRVRDLMNVNVITAPPDSDIETVMTIMTENRIRHLPIVCDGDLCGMISIGDVVNALRHRTEVENGFLHAYIEGTPR